MKIRPIPLCDMSNQRRNILDKKFQMDLERRRKGLNEDFISLLDDESNDDEVEISEIDSYNLSFSPITDEETLPKGTISSAFQSLTKELSNLHTNTLETLESIIEQLPSPLGKRRSDNKLVFFCATAIVLFLSLHNLFTSPKFHRHDGVKQIQPDYDLAYRESSGYFNDIPANVWNEKKERIRKQPKNNDAALGVRSKYEDRDVPKTW